jgi:phospholipase C
MLAAYKSTAWSESVIRSYKSIVLLTPIALAATLTLAACNDDSSSASTTPPPVDTTAALQKDVQNIVVIYAENRSFDNLFGNFPGANGLSTVVDASGKPTSAYVPQVDRDGTLLATLPPTWGGVTAPGNRVTVTQAQSMGLPNAPFAVETGFQAATGFPLTTVDVNRDLYHRFFENQMSIDGGKNDKFAAWEDAGGLTMGHWDYSTSALYKLAQENVLADNFFEGALSAERQRAGGCLRKRRALCRHE